MRTLILALPILLILGGIFPETSVTNPARVILSVPPACASESHGSLLNPGGSSQWNVTVQACTTYGYGLASFYGVEVTPMPGFWERRPSLVRWDNLSFSPRYVFLGDIPNGSSRQATFTATLPNSTPAGFYSHTSLVNYDDIAGFPRVINLTSTIKVTSLNDPRGLNISAAVYVPFLEASLKRADGSPVANALVEACTDLGHAPYYAFVDAQPTDFQGHADFPRDELRGLSNLVVEYTLSPNQCAGNVGKTSSYVGASVALVPEPASLPAYAAPVALTLVSSYAIESLAVFSLFQRNRRGTAL